MFSERGASASTEEVARRAGVAIGTVFRHFPTKDDLLRAIMKDLLQQLSGEAASLAAEGDPATALFTFFTRMVSQAAAKKTVIDLLAATGTAIDIAEPVQGLQQQITELLALAKRAGAVREDVQIAEVTALLVSTCQGALQARWNSDLQGRVLTVIFDGLGAVPSNGQARRLTLVAETARWLRLDGNGSVNWQGQVAACLALSWRRGG